MFAPVFAKDPPGIKAVKRLRNERDLPLGIQARWYAVGLVSCKFAVSLPRKMTLDRYSFLVFSPCLCIMQVESGRRREGERAKETGRG